MAKVVRIECTVKATSDVHASSIFRLASSRLLHVRDWPRLTDCLLSSSEHRDMHGVPASRPVKTDDYINLTNEAMRPFGWMQVVYVAEIEEENAGEVAMLTRSVELPFEADNENHFETKPTLLHVVRRGLDVTAAFVMESNPSLTAFERLGVHVVQWRSLVNGILSNLRPVEHPMLSHSLSAESHFV